MLLRLTDARVALIGFPSVGLSISVPCLLVILTSFESGKSTLLSKVSICIVEVRCCSDHYCQTTNTASETAAYEFTTLTVNHITVSELQFVSKSRSGYSRGYRICGCSYSAAGPPGYSRRGRSRCIVDFNIRFK